MLRNIGSTDRLLRLVLGAVLVLFAVFSPMGMMAGGGMMATTGLGWLKWVALIAGVVFILTALINFCPLYRLLGISTARIDS